MPLVKCLFWLKLKKYNALICSPPADAISVKITAHSIEVKSRVKLSQQEPSNHHAQRGSPARYRSNMTSLSCFSPHVNAAWTPGQLFQLPAKRPPQRSRLRRSQLPFTTCQCSGSDRDLLITEAKIAC